MSNDKRFTDKWLGGDTNAVMTELARQLGGEDQLRRFQKGRITIVPQEVRKNSLHPPWFPYSERY